MARKRLEARLRRGAWPTAPGLAALVLLMAGCRGTSDADVVRGADAVPGAETLAAEPSVTFAADVAPILQRRCQVCHQPGSIAPFSLLTYEDARQWAPLMKERVVRRIMPPFHIDRTVGVQGFENDPSLTDEEIRTIAQWVDTGTPLGDPSELPPPVEWPDGREFFLRERLGPPDLVIRSEPYSVPATGQDQWWRPTVETGLTEPRWLRAVEVKPSYPAGRRVTHHVLATLLQDEPGITGLASTAADAGVNSGGLLTEWAIGKVGEIYPEGTGKLLLPGSRIRWEVHYYPDGEAVPDDQVELALWFYPKGEEPKYRTILNMFNVAPTSRLEIPPRSVAVHQNSFRLPAPARIESFQPHMHLRGKAMSMEAIYPDGRKEMLSMVSDFQFKWHVNYIYEEDVAPLLPAGTILLFTVWHDNTPEHPGNPDPDQFVTWGDRAVDEMGHAWVSVTYLEQEDFDRLVAERQERARRVARSETDG